VDPMLIEFRNPINFFFCIEATRIASIYLYLLYLSPLRQRTKPYFECYFFQKWAAKVGRISCLANFFHVFLQKKYKTLILKGTFYR
ncbi:MAG: hypothetical protein LBT48_03690, partial [Prevotellaceae bacterium]|nr:hypothetical protein [Prevotellaceae bacterium]